MTTFIVRSVISQTNQHPLILDGHGSHVTLETIKQAHSFELDIITFLIIPFTNYNPEMYHVLSFSKQHLKGNLRKKSNDHKNIFKT